MKKAFNYRTGQYEPVDLNSPLDNAARNDEVKTFRFLIRKKHHLPLVKWSTRAKTEEEAIAKLPKNVFWCFNNGFH